MTADARGRAGEQAAQTYLQTQGYEVLATRFRRRNGVGGEIDLIVMRHDVVAFTEVKTYRDRAAALDAITPRAQARIAAAAEAWLAENSAYLSHTLRFDLVLVLAKGKIEHIPNAWSLE